MDEYDAIGTLSSRLSYVISGSLVVGDWLTFIDHHSWIVGAVLGLLTWITNIYFKVKAHNAKS